MIHPRKDSTMNRTLIYPISEQHSGMTIQEFLKAQGFSSQNIIELKKMPESVLINGEWVYLTRRLCDGEELVIHIQENDVSEKIPPIKLPLQIVYEDEDILVANKPADMPIHPSLNNYENSLANAVAYYYAEQGKPFVFRCINRLDRDTSGLTVIAKHMVSAGILSSMVADKKASGMTREYLAIVRGMVTPAQGTIDAPIARKDSSVIERVVDFERGERAITHYKVLETKNGHSLVSLQLETGRTHQIRVHMKHIGFPLIGDYLYNPDMEHISRQALHSYKLSFLHPITKEPMTFTAPMPEDMQKVLS